jgi:hypothetical protein
VATGRYRSGITLTTVIGLDGLMVELRDIEDPFGSKLGGERPVAIILFEPTS